MMPATKKHSRQKEQDSACRSIQQVIAARLLHEPFLSKNKRTADVSNRCIAAGIAARWIKPQKQSLQLASARLDTEYTEIKHAKYRFHSSHQRDDTFLPSSSRCEVKNDKTSYDAAMHVSRVTLNK